MWEFIKNETKESISWKEKTNTALQEISTMTDLDKKELVQFMKEKTDTPLIWLEKELNKENITLINEFAKKMIADNKLNPEDQILLFNALADNLSTDFPEISKTLKIFGWINDVNWNITEDMVFKRLNEMQSIFINKGYFINTDRITTWEDLIMKIEWEKSPNEVINLVFWNDIDIRTLSPSIVLNDKTYKKFWFNIWNTSVANKWEIKNFIEEWYKKWRYTAEQLQTFDLDNIAEATVNHETSHALMSRYNFPDRKELDLKAGKDE